MGFSGLGFGVFGFGVFGFKVKGGEIVARGSRGDSCLGFRVFEGLFFFWGGGGGGEGGGRGVGGLDAQRLRGFSVSDLLRPTLNPKP